MISRNLQKIFSILTLLFFLSSEASRVHAAFPEPQHSESFSSLALTFPETLGSVRSLSVGRPGDPVLFHIHTAHGSFEAARGVAAILDSLQKQYGVSLVFAEGASLPPQRDFLQFSPDSQINQRLKTSLAQSGELSGPDLVLDDSRFQVLGLETPLFYCPAFKAFKKVQHQNAKTLKSLELLRLDMDSKSSNAVRPELWRLIRQWLEFQEQTHDLAGLLRVLDRESQDLFGVDFRNPLQQREWPQMSRLAFYRELEKDRDDSVFAEEISRLQAWLKSHRVDTAIVSRLTKPEGANARLFYETFLSQTHSLGFRFRDYPQTMRRAAMQVLEEELNAGDLFGEINRLFEKLFRERAAGPGEREVVEQYRRWVRLKRLVSLELSRGEWNPWKPAQGLPELGQAGLAAAVRSAAEFYRLAEIREVYFRSRIFSEMEARGQRTAVLVTGGFHGEGMKQLFDGKAGYASLEPRIAAETGRRFYVQAMLGTAHLEKPEFAQPAGLGDADYYRGEMIRVRQAARDAGVELAGQSVWEKDRRGFLGEKPALTVTPKAELRVDQELRGRVRTLLDVVAPSLRVLEEIQRRGDWGNLARGPRLLLGAEIELLITTVRQFHEPYRVGERSDDGSRISDVMNNKLGTVSMQLQLGDEDGTYARLSGSLGVLIQQMQRLMILYEMPGDLNENLRAHHGDGSYFNAPLSAELASHSEEARGELRAKEWEDLELWREAASIIRRISAGESWRDIINSGLVSPPVSMLVRDELNAREEEARQDRPATGAEQLRKKATVRPDQFWPNSITFTRKETLLNPQGRKLPFAFPEKAPQAPGDLNLHGARIQKVSQALELIRKTQPDPSVQALGDYAVIGVDLPTRYMNFDFSEGKGKFYYADPAKGTIYLTWALLDDLQLKNPLHMNFLAVILKEAIRTLIVESVIPTTKFRKARLVYPLLNRIEEEIAYQSSRVYAGRDMARIVEELQERDGDARERLRDVIQAFRAVTLPQLKSVIDLKKKADQKPDRMDYANLLEAYNHLAFLEERISWIDASQKSFLRQIEAIAGIQEVDSGFLPMEIQERKAFIYLWSGQYEDYLAALEAFLMTPFYETETSVRGFPRVVDPYELGYLMNYAFRNLATYEFKHKTVLRQREMKVAKEERQRLEEVLGRAVKIFEDFSARYHLRHSFFMLYHVSEDSQRGKPFSEEPDIGAMVTDERSNAPEFTFLTREAARAPEENPRVTIQLNFNKEGASLLLRSPLPIPEGHVLRRTLPRIRERAEAFARAHGIMLKDETYKSPEEERERRIQDQIARATHRFVSHLVMDGAVFGPSLSFEIPFDVLQKILPLLPEPVQLAYRGWFENVRESIKRDAGIFYAHRDLERLLHEAERLFTGLVPATGPIREALSALEARDTELGLLFLEDALRWIEDEMGVDDESVLDFFFNPSPGFRSLPLIAGELRPRAELRTSTAGERRDAFFRDVNQTLRSLDVHLNHEHHIEFRYADPMDVMAMDDPEDTGDVTAIFRERGFVVGYYGLDENAGAPAARKPVFRHDYLLDPEGNGPSYEDLLDLISRNILVQEGIFPLALFGEWKSLMARWAVSPRAELRTADAHRYYLNVDEMIRQIYRGRDSGLVSLFTAAEQPGGVAFSSMASILLHFFNMQDNTAAVYDPESAVREAYNQVKQFYAAANRGEILPGSYEQYKALIAYSRSPDGLAFSRLTGRVHAYLQLKGGALLEKRVMPGLRPENTEAAARPVLYLAHNPLPYLGSLVSSGRKTVTVDIDNGFTSGFLNGVRENLFLQQAYEHRIANLFDFDVASVKPGTVYLENFGNYMRFEDVSETIAQGLPQGPERNRNEGDSYKAWHDAWRGVWRQTVRRWLKESGPGVEFILRYAIENPQSERNHEPLVEAFDEVLRAEGYEHKIGYYDDKGVFHENAAGGLVGKAGAQVRHMTAHVFRIPPRSELRMLEEGAPERMVNRLIADVQKRRAPSWMAQDYRPGYVKIGEIVWEGLGQPPGDSRKGKILQALQHLERTGADALAREKVRRLLEILEKHPLADELTLLQFEAVAHQIVHSYSGNPDAYAGYKEKLDRDFQSVYPQIRERVLAVADPREQLWTALVYAGIGNLIDPSHPDALKDAGISGSLGLAEQVSEVYEKIDSRGLAMGRQDFESFYSNIQVHPGKTVLYFLDNHGEFILDQIAIETLLRQGYQVAVVAKGRNIRDDVTSEEARVNISRNDFLADFLRNGRLKVVTDGSYLLGADLSQSSGHPEFLEAWSQGIGVIAKGAGSWHTLPGQKLSLPLLHLRMMKGSKEAYRRLAVLKQESATAPDPLHMVFYYQPAAFDAASARARGELLDKAYAALESIPFIRDTRGFGIDDLKFSRELAVEINRHPIQDVLVAGDASRLLPLLLALTGKKVTFVDWDAGKAQTVRSYWEDIRKILKDQGVQDLNLDFEIAVHVQEFGSLDVRGLGLEKKFDLITFLDLTGGSGVVGDPEEWFDNVRKLFKGPEGYVVMDRERDSANRLFDRTFPEKFRTLLAPRPFHGIYNFAAQLPASNYFYRVAFPPDESSAAGTAGAQRSEHRVVTYDILIDRDKFMRYGAKFKDPEAALEEERRVVTEGLKNDPSLLLKVYTKLGLKADQVHRVQVEWIPTEGVSKELYQIRIFTEGEDAQPSGVAALHTTLTYLKKIRNTSFSTLHEINKAERFRTAGHKDQFPEIYAHNWSPIHHTPLIFSEWVEGRTLTDLMRDEVVRTQGSLRKDQEGLGGAGGKNILFSEVEPGLGARGQDAVDNQRIAETLRPWAEELRPRILELLGIVLDSLTATGSSYEFEPDDVMIEKNTGRLRLVDPGSRDVRGPAFNQPGQILEAFLEDYTSYEAASRYKGVWEYMKPFLLTPREVFQYILEREPDSGAGRKFLEKAGRYLAGRAAASKTQGVVRELDQVLGGPRAELRSTEPVAEGELKDLQKQALFLGFDKDGLEDLPETFPAEFIETFEDTKFLTREDLGKALHELGTGQRIEAIRAYRYWIWKQGDRKDAELVKHGNALAKAAGFSSSNYVAVKRMKAGKWPEPQNLWNLARVLKVDPTLILFGEPLGPAVFEEMPFNEVMRALRYRLGLTQEQFALRLQKEGESRSPAVQVFDTDDDDHKRSAVTQWELAGKGRRAVVPEPFKRPIITAVLGYEGVFDNIPELPSREKKAPRTQQKVVAYPIQPPVPAVKAVLTLPAPPPLPEKTPGEIEFDIWERFLKEGESLAARGDADFFETLQKLMHYIEELSDKKRWRGVGRHFPIFESLVLNMADTYVAQTGDQKLSAEDEATVTSLLENARVFFDQPDAAWRTHPINVWLDQRRNEIYRNVLEAKFLRNRAADRGMQDPAYTSLLDRAEALLQDSRSISREDPYVLHGLAEVALRRRDAPGYEAAERYLKQILKTTPDYVPALNSLGRMAFAQGDIMGALSRYGTVLDIRPDDAVAMNSLGQVSLWLDKPWEDRLQEAAYYFERVLERHPGNVYGLVGHAKVLYLEQLPYLVDTDTHLKSSDLEEDRWRVLRQAREELQQAIRSQHDQDRTYVSLGIFYMAIGDYRAAREAFETAFKLNKDSARAERYMSMTNEQYDRERGNLRDLETRRSAESLPRAREAAIELPEAEAAPGESILKGEVIYGASGVEKIISGDAVFLRPEIMSRLNHRMVSPKVLILDYPAYREAVSGKRVTQNVREYATRFAETYLQKREIEIIVFQNAPYDFRVPAGAHFAGRDVVALKGALDEIPHDHFELTLKIRGARYEASGKPVSVWGAKPELRSAVRPGDEPLLEAYKMRLAALGLELADDAGRIRYRADFKPLELKFNLVAIPHGQTDANLTGILHGRADGKPENFLNADGIAQATAGGEELAALIRAQGWNLDDIVFLRSPLERTHQTWQHQQPALAGLDASRNFEPVVEENAAEISFGEWDGKTLDQVLAQLGPVEARWVEQYRNLNALARSPTGENFLMFLERVRAFVESLNERYAGKTVILYGHGTQSAALKVLFGAADFKAKSHIDWRDHKVVLPRGRPTLFPAARAELRSLPGFELTGLDLIEGRLRIPDEQLWPAKGPDAARFALSVVLVGGIGGKDWPEPVRLAYDGFFHELLKAADGGALRRRASLQKISPSQLIPALSKTQETGFQLIRLFDRLPDAESPELLVLADVAARYPGIQMLLEVAGADRQRLKNLEAALQKDILARRRELGSSLKGVALRVVDAGSFDKGLLAGSGHDRMLLFGADRGRLNTLRMEAVRRNVSQVLAVEDDVRGDAAALKEASALLAALDELASGKPLPENVVSAGDLLGRHLDLVRRLTRLIDQAA